MIIPLASPLLARSSDLPESVGWAIRAGPTLARRLALSYLVLLRAGFCLPPVLPRARCALTAPFHPYPPSRFALRRGKPRDIPHRRRLSRVYRAVARSAKVGGIFS